jgi:pimeloyl-ACP methyl ester carboxylesterase
MSAIERPGGVELQFRVRGDGPTVMLAPYWSGQPGVYEGFLSDLSRDHRVVTWDARGTGESTHDGPYDVETDSTDLEAMLEHVGAAAIVIGVANGCNTATHVAARRADLIGTVLAFGAGPFSLRDFEGSEAMLGSEGVVTAFLEMLERDYRGALRTVFSSTNAQMSEDELRERISSQISYCPQDAAVARVRAWAADDPGEAAAALGARLRVFSSDGVAGTWLPPLAERREIMARVTPEAQVEEITDEEGPISRPDLVASRIRELVVSAQILY